MATVDAMDALPVAPKARQRRNALPQAGMADDMGPPEPGLDPVVVDVDVSPKANLRFDGAGRSGARARLVEDAMDEEAADAGDAGDDLGEVGRAPGGQRPQCRNLGLHSDVPAAVAAGDELINEAPPVGDIGDVAGAAQDQRLVEGGLEMTVVGFPRAVLMG